MAETYRGLTIRIGGDATSLQKALRAVNQSIAQTETQLRKMRQALNMDPGNMEAIETNLRLVGQRAVEAQSKLAQLKRSLQEVGSQRVELFGGKQSSQTIRELADATEDASERAAMAKRNYAEVVEQLAQVRNEIQRLTGIDLDDELNPDETVQTMRELGMISDEVADNYARLRSSYEGAFNENEIAKAVVQMRDLETETTKAGAQASSLASRFSELSRSASGLNLSGDLDVRLKQVDNAAESVNNELRRLDKALSLDDGNVDAVAMKMRDLQEASGLASQRMEILTEKLDQMSSAGIGRLSDDTDDLAIAAQRAQQEYDDASEAVVRLRGQLSDLRSQQSLLKAKDDGLSDEYRELCDQIKAAETQLDNLVATQREAKAAFDSTSQVSEYRELQTQIAETRSQQNQLNDEMAEMGRLSGITKGSLTSLGMSLSTSVTPTILAMGYGMTQATYDIDAAYRDMRKTVDGTEQQFEELRQAAVDFSTTHVTSADQILSIQAIGGELGIATEDLKVFAETVSNLDVATNINAEDAATALGQLNNILGDLTADKFPAFSDALVRLGNNGASTESQIVDIAARIGAMGSIVGMTTPEILAWSSTVASTGQGAEAAGTAISKTISDIETAVANGGDSLEAFASVAGMSAEEFASAWEATPSDAMHAFIDGLNEVEESGGSAVTTLSDLGITSVRQVQAIQGLMQMIGGLNDNLTMSEDAWNGVSDEWGQAGDAANEATAKAEGFSGAVSRVDNIAQAIGAELGDSLVPAINMVADVLGDLYDWFSDLPDEVKQSIVVFGALTAALGPMILLGKGVSEFISGVGKGLKSLGTAAKAAKSIKSLSSSMEVATKATSGLSLGLEGLGVALAVGGIAALVGHLMDEAEQARLAERATKGLADACGMASSGMADANDETFNYSESIREVTDANREGVESLAALADEFDDLNQQTSASLGRLDDAESAIRNYAGKTDLTAVEIGELESAIDYLNDTCGTSYSVLRDSDGAYQVMEDGAIAAKDAIYDLIDAQEFQVQMEAQNQKLSRLYDERAPLEDTYSDALDAEMDAYKEYQDALNAFNEERAKGNEAYEQEVHLNDARAHWQELAKATKDAESSLNDVDERIEQVNGTMGNMEQAEQGAADGMEAFVMFSGAIQGEIGTSKEAIDAFCDAMEEAGISTDDLSKMSTAELQRFSKEWATTGDDVSDILARMGIDLNGMASNLRSTFESMAPGGGLSTSLQNMGYDLDQLSVAMSNAGITSGQLYAIGAENFAMLAQSAGGDTGKLIQMLQNYNAQPIYNKDGSINVNDVSLIDALGNVYTWNGSTLNTLNGDVVIQTQQITDANGEIYEWNNQGKLVDPSGQIVIDDTQLKLANGEIATYSNGQLKTKEGTVIVGFNTLEDCNGAMVEYNDTNLKPIEGQVDVDYSDVTNAISAIDSLLSRNGRTATVHLNTVQTTTQRTVVEAPSKSSRSLSTEARAAATPLMSVSLPADSAMAIAPLSRVRASGAAYAANALSENPGMFAAISRSVVSESQRPLSVEVSGRSITSSVSNRDVVMAIEELRRELPSIIYKSAPEMPPRDFIRGVNKAVKMSA